MMIYFFLITQVILESLPISSSGHILLLTHIFGSTVTIPQSFDYLMHGPTVIVLLVYFFSEWFYVVSHVKKYQKHAIYITGLVFLANCVTVLLYIGFKYTHVSVPLWLGLSITAFSLLSLKLLPTHPTENKTISISQALIIGVSQGVALLPGISRLGLTYVTGRWLGLSTYWAFRFSCALQITLFAAGSLRGLVQSMHDPLFFYLINPLFLLLVIGASFIAYVELYWVERAMRLNILWYLGIYMLVPITLALYLGL